MDKFTENQLNEMYLNWIKIFKSKQDFADFYEIDLDLAIDIIERGRDK